MASENLKIDENSRWVLGAVTNDGNEFIKNVRVNPITGALVVEANVTSTNTMIGSTIPGGTAGSVLFLDIGGTLAEDNSYFFYDPTDHFLALGNNNPSATLDLKGTFKYVDGNQTNGYVLTSDSAGNATWQAPQTGNSGYNLIQNNGTSVTQRTTINLSTLLTATDNGGKTALTINTVNLANDNTFVTTLAANNTFAADLVANTTFTTGLANNSNFYTTLGNNTSFIGVLTSNSTFMSDITTITSTQGAIIVQNSGTPLSGAAGVLNFTGSGVVASGTGLTKTITINTGSGSTTQIDQTPLGSGSTYGALGGTVNGSNTTFTVSKSLYTSGKLQVYRNGLVQFQGSNGDWVETTPSSGTFSFNVAPLTGDILTAIYAY